VEPTAIDLFAGPGGLSLGLEMAGFKVLGAIELDNDAGDTYRRNFDHPSKQMDITQYRPKEFRNFLEKEGILQEGEGIDLVAGGPPCPGFSLIGRSKIADLIKKGEYGDSKEYRHRFIDDPRNELFREFVKYVDEFQPSYFIMENVSGMTSYQIDDDPIVEVIKASFDGYDVRYRVLNSSDYGVPQYRKRIIFLGHKTGLPEAKWPKHSDEEIKTAGEVIADLSDISLSKDGRGDIFSHWTRETNDRDKVLFKFIKSGSPKGEICGLKIKSSEPRQIYGDIFPSMWKSELVPAFNRAGMRAWKYGRCFVQSESGRKWKMYEQEGFKDKMRRIRWDRPSPTVVAHLAKDGYMFIHPWKDRTITVREAARFQSFPDDFEFEGSMTAQFRQVGNAVPPLLAKAIGESVMESLSSILN
jgi:DNA (cytosine-5)-methyltransferase 1